MFEVGDLVFFGQGGVCRVLALSTSEFEQDKGRLYYVLKPVFSVSTETVYLPTDSKVRLRSVMKREEAEGVLQAAATLSVKVFASKNVTLLKSHYKELLASGSVQDCLLLLKEVDLKRRQGKKLGQVDEQYASKIENLLGEELAVALELPLDEAKEALRKAIAL
ncbi:MAG: hypothetical protein IJF71_02440 [Clostridia bacterium]|nr:hypothetical protein [Clostridia bacterium]